MTKSAPQPVASRVSTLREEREKAGLSLQALADRLNVSPQAVHQYEKSESAGTISLRQLDGVARAMGLRLDYALTPLARKSRAAAARPSLEQGHRLPRLPSRALGSATHEVSPQPVSPDTPATAVSLDRFSVHSD